MSVLMPYFWPCFAIGLVVGVIIGVFAFHKWPTRKRNIALGIGAIVAICLALVWHGPLGAANRFTATVEKTAPTSTTNMTGLRIMTRGSSFRRASGSEVTSIFGSSNPPATRLGPAP